MAIARSMGTAGGALAYLVKRLYSMNQLAMSTLAVNSKKDLEQLPPDEIDAIKGMHNKTIRMCLSVITLQRIKLKGTYFLIIRFH